MSSKNVYTKQKYYIDGKEAGTMYSFSHNSLLSRHEVTLYRSIDGEWSGDTIAYGEWRDLDDIEIEGYKRMIGE